MGIIGELRKCIHQICIDICAVWLMLGHSIVFMYACDKYMRVVKTYLREKESTRFKSIMEFKCSQCSKSYSTKKSLNNHTRLQHGNPKQFLCIYCDYMTPNEGHLDMHIRSQHTNIKELCSECSKPFSNQSNVYRHKRKLHCKKEAA